MESEKSGRARRWLLSTLFSLCPLRRGVCHSGVWEMNAFDAVILGLVVVFLIRGVIRGFLQETLGLLGLVLAVLLSVRFLDSVTSVLSGFIALNPSIVSAISFVLIFVTVIVAVRIVIAALRGVLRAASLTWVDRLGGGVVGAIKGSILAGVFALLVSVLPLASSLAQLRSESVLVEPFRGVLPLTFDLVRRLWPGTKQFVDELGETFEKGFVESQVKDVLEGYGFKKGEATRDDASDE